MASPDLVVATHGHCFDGMASAAVFTHFLRLFEDRPLTTSYWSCGYGPSMGVVPDGWLSGVQNAILDFRYSPSSKVSWYFDHHVTAFASADEKREALERERVFYDASYGSCTKLIADRAMEAFSIDVRHADLVSWADRIDAARFESAEAATDRDNPVLRLAAVVEHHGDGPFLKEIIPQLIERPLLEVASGPKIQALYEPIGQSYAAQVQRIAKGAKMIGRVVYVDLTDAPLEVAAKFVTYALFPEAVYSVTLSRSKHVKLSVGYNPWSGVERDHDISAICKSLGGGGHPVVGAATFPLADVERAQAAAASICRMLDEPPHPEPR